MTDPAGSSAGEPARREPAVEAPPDLPEYEVLRPIGTGGMGSVHLARHRASGRTVALKVLRADLAGDREFTERFLREMRVAARVTHPAVIEVQDSGAAAGRLFIAMEYVDGGDLVSRIARGPLPEDEALRIAARCADGLAAIHAAGLVHRDVKPDNVLFDADGSVKIGDLGMARTMAGSDRLTRTGEALGTPSYMAPEQAEGLTELDARTDVYGLGATLYAMLTGRPPFDGPSAYATVAKVMGGDAPDVRSIAPRVSAAAAAIVARAMAKDRAARFPDVAEMAQALRAVAGGEPAEQPGERRTRRWGSIAVAIAALAFVVTLLAAMSYGSVAVRAVEEPLGDVRSAALQALATEGARGVTVAESHGRSVIRGEMHGRRVTVEVWAEGPATNLSVHVGLLGDAPAAKALLGRIVAEL